MTTMAIYWQRANRKVLAVVVVSAALLVQASLNNYKVLTAKAEQQNNALSQLKRWKQEYEALLPIQSQWEKAITPAKQMTDIYNVYNSMLLEQYGLNSSQEKLLIKEIKPVQPNGVSLNATQVCIHTAGETGLAVTAPHFSPDLLSGLDKLANRRDVQISNIVLSAANGIPKAVIDMCLVFRA